MSNEESQSPARERVWLPHKPEDRLSIVTSRFLNAALVPPFYVTALADDDEGQRTRMQRIRGRERGQEPGQLDYDVWQGAGAGYLARKLELKRGNNKPSANQLVTIKKLTDLGAPPVVAWDLRGVWRGLRNEGFRFLGNVETLLQKYEADLDALDRGAELTLSGGAPAKKPRKSKAGPRYSAGKRFQARANKAGILF
jgi:hypothetical protein